MNTNRQIVTTEHIYYSRMRAHLMCGFYGPSHPMCKKAIEENNALYTNFVKQFKTVDESIKDDTDNKDK